MVRPEQPVWAGAWGIGPLKAEPSQTTRGCSVWNQAAMRTQNGENVTLYHQWQQRVLLRENIS